MTLRFRRYEGAGYSAEHRYRVLRAAWRRRVFGRANTYVWAIVILSILVLPSLSGLWSFGLTGVTASLAVGWMIISDSPPDHVARWRRGAWGEQKTAKVLRPLKGEGWVVRHDLRVGAGNRDHVLAGPAVYLLDSKLLPDELTLEGTALRVRRIDEARDSYLIDGLTPWMKRAAKSLSWEIQKQTGERLFVYPVVVLWGKFDAGIQEADGVYYVDGDLLRGWLRSRPISLYNRRRAAVSDWLRVSTFTNGEAERLPSDLETSD